MELTGWTIDRCGHLSDHTVSGVGPHVTVLLGPNEAGKTTTHHFLRWVLLGFPSANHGTFRRYRGGAATVGGRLRLRHDGRDLVLERSSGAGPARLLDPTGAPATGVTVAEVVGPTTPELYRSVFAVGLDELHEVGALDRDELREHLFAAGLVGAGRSAADAIARLDRTRAQLLGVRRGGAVRDLARELTEARAELASARQRAEHLGAARAEADRLEAAAAAAWAEEQDATAAAELFEGLVELWPLWAGRSDAAREAADLPRLDLGEDPAGALDASADELAAAEAALERLEARRDRLAAQLGDCDVDERLAGGAELVGEARAAHRHAVARLDELHAEQARWDHERAAVGRAVAELGPGWDVDRVLATPLTPADLAEADARAAALASADEARRATGLDLESAQRRLDAALAHATELQERQPDGTPTSDPRALADLAGRVEELAARRAAIEELAVLGKDGDRDPSAGGTAPPAGVVSGVAAAVVLVLAAVAAATGAPVLAALLGASALAAGIASAVLLRGGRPATDRTSEPVVALLEDRQARVDAAAAELSARFEALGLPAHLPAAALRSMAADAAGREELRRALEQAAAAVRAGEAALDDARRRHDGARARHGAAAAGWSELVAPLGLPPGTGAAAVTATLRLVGTARERLTRLDDERERLERRAALVRRDLDRIRGTLAELGEPAPDDAGPDDLGRRLDDLRRRCGTAVEAAVQRDGLTRRLAELDDDLAVARSEVGRRASAVAELLAAAGVDDADRFRRLVEADRRRRGLEELVRAADHAVLERFGAGDRAEQARKELSLGRTEDWSAGAAGARDRARRLAEERAGLHRLAADARHAVRSVEAAADVAAGEMEVDRLTHELADAAGEWVRLTIARDALAETLDRFERERQPEVVARAAASLARVTSGRWDGVVAADRSLEVRAPGGARVPDALLSRGTAEQLYLCMRLSLARTHAERTARLPVLLDDVFVNADDGRNRALAEEVARIAEDVQVVVFTARRSTARALVRARPDTPVLELGPGGASPATGWTADDVDEEVGHR